ncbi:MAG: sulfatase-like hydrolase/transferase [Opitutaceae bacterium]|nr:sulfatase-like hydrolase/transferase [Opitutaceae bacterium]
MPKRQAVFFLIDTQGANCVGCYRPELALGTPHVDGLASLGLRFDRAYTCAPVCGPARSALLTGLYPHSNGVLGNDMAPTLDVPTLGQRLQAAGFSTGYIGKWHLDGSDYFGDGRCPAGWDARYWFDGRNYLNSLPDDAVRDLSRRALGPADIAAHGITSDFTHAHRTADRAIDFIREHRDRDFFLVVSIDEPHHPWITPEPFASAFENFEFPVPNADDPLTDKPRNQREWAAHTVKWEASIRRRDGRAWLHHPRHFACNSYSDSQVGRVLGAVDANTPDALVVYTSDHGDMFGSHRLHGKGPCVYDEITRVPLIVRWPGHSPAAAVSDGPVSHIDVVPSFLEYFGVPVPDLLQGRSLLRQCREPAHRTNTEVFIEFNRFEIDHDGFGAFSPIRGVFDGRHKLAINLLDTDEFYDVVSDPLELKNLIAEPALAPVRDRLHAVLLAWMNRTRDPLRGPHWKRRPWRRGDEGSTWDGPTRPRPFDEPWYPKTLLYDTGKVIDRYEYDKG